MTDGKAAVAADTSSQAGSEAPDGQSELDKALAELEGAAGQKPEQKPQSAPDKGEDRVTKLEKQLQDMQRASAVERANAGVKNVVSTLLKNDAIKAGYSHESLEALLQWRGANDERLALAFAERERKPEVWAKVLKAFENELATEAAGRVERKAPSRSSSEAVRGIETSAPSEAESKIPPQAELSAMTDAEFAKLQAKLAAGG